jgi:hypothetical protein
MTPNEPDPLESVLGPEAFAVHTAEVERRGGVRQPGEPTMVKLPGGFVVRSRFTRRATRLLPDHLPAEIGMTIDVNASGRADVVAVFLSSLETLGDAELTALGADLVNARDELVKIEAQEMTPDRGYTPAEASSANVEDFAAVIGRDADAALRSVRTARRRRITPELLAAVRDLYEAGGIQQVMAGTNYSESYCFKLLRRARQEVAS